MGQNFPITVTCECLILPRKIVQKTLFYNQADHKGRGGGGEGQPSFALTVSKCENFDPILELKFDHLIFITHFISLIVTVRQPVFWTASIIKKNNDFQTQGVPAAGD